MSNSIGLKLAFLFTLWNLNAQGQQKYWVDDQTPLERPVFCSEWLGRCSYILENDEVKALRRKGIGLTPVLSFEPLSTDTRDTILGFALEQIGAKAFIDLGLNGSGVKIGIIDGGFLKANKDPSLRHLFKNNKVKFYRDYITPEMEPYGGAIGLDDNHGTEVWQLIGGRNLEKNILYGLATASDYYLARTDHGGYEKRMEEDLLIEALEDMAKKGIRLVNISLGYNIGYTNPSENYRPDQMDGETSMLSRAVDYAALNKGMLIVVAAGNEAKLSWQTLSTPADARFALTVGSSKFEIWDKMDYSSIGPEYTDFVKPDVAVYATMGTSYSAPIVTGMAACMWQKDSSLTNFEIMDLIKRASNFYPYPNNYLGYGVPTCSNILKLMNEQSLPGVDSLHVKSNYYKLENLPENVSYVIAYHKKDNRNVLARVMYRPKGKPVKVKRLEGATQTSILTGTRVLELFWLD